MSVLVPRACAHPRPQAAQGGALQHLVWLSLSQNPIGDLGTAALAKGVEDSTVLPRLAELHLCGIGASESGLTALCETIMPKVGHAGLPALYVGLGLDPVKNLCVTHQLLGCLCHHTQCVCVTVTVTSSLLVAHPEVARPTPLSAGAL